MLRSTIAACAALLLAAVGRRWGVALEPAGPNRFASRDGRVVVAFDAGYDTLTLIESAGVTLASRGAGVPVQ
jgi:hypothetical protein